MVKIYRNSADAPYCGEFIVSTDVTNLFFFEAQLAQVILETLEKFPNEKSEALNSILNRAFPIAFKLEGYKQDMVNETKVLTCGFSDPSECNLIAQSTITGATLNPTTGKTFADNGIENHDS